MNDEDALDAALEIVSTLSPEYGGELSDHTPMVCEALVRLGAADAIGPYLARVVPKRRALTDERAPALVAFASTVKEAQGDLDRLGVAPCLERWLRRVIAGFSGGAFHGAIRVGHALRALERRDCAARRAELARALAYTVLRAEPLPEGAPSDPSLRGLAEALAEIAPSPDALSTRETALISTALVERAGRHPTLAAFAASLATPVDPRAGLRQLRASAIDVLLRGESLPQATFTMLHGVTGMDAAVAMGDLLEPSSALLLWRGAAHALLALRVAFVGRYPVVHERPVAAQLPLLVEAAISSLDDHAIKLAAALAEASEDVAEGARAEALSCWVRPPR